MPPYVIKGKAKSGAATDAVPGSIAASQAKCRLLFLILAFLAFVFRAISLTSGMLNDRGRLPTGFTMADTNEQRTVVIVPTYNEIENVEALILAVLELPQPIDILIVDDNSPDGTGQRVKEIAARDTRVSLLARDRKQGLGTAYVAGFREALKRGYEFIMEMDCDFSHNPKDLLRLRDAMQDQDLVIGSRYIGGVHVTHWPLRRLLLSMGASWYTRLITWMPIRDTTAGFKCFRRRILETINLDTVRSNGYAFQIEMHYKTWKLGFRIKEIPIVFTDRVGGISKMGAGIVKEAILAVWRLRFSRVTEFRRHAAPTEAPH